MRPPLIHVPVLAVAAVAGLLLAAGCGGSPKASVASLTTSSTATATTSTSSSAPPPAAPGGSGSGGQFRMVMRVGADGAKFSACMRSNGVPNFPDPNGQGVISIQSGMGVDPGSPKFQAAQQTCRKLLPNGGQPTPAQLAQMQQNALAFSVCMRKHGVTNFPDPSFSGGGVHISIRPGTNLDPSSPTFQAAQKACQGIIGKGGGPLASGRLKSAG